MEATACAGRVIDTRDRRSSTRTARAWPAPAPEVRQNFPGSPRYGSRTPNKIFIHARASAARVPVSCCPQGERSRTVPPGPSGSAAGAVLASGAAERRRRGPERPRPRVEVRDARRRGGELPATGTRRPKDLQKRPEKSTREKKLQKNLPGLLTFGIYLYIFVYTEAIKPQNIYGVNQMKKKEILEYLKLHLEKSKIVSQSCKDNPYPYMYGYLEAAVEELIKDLESKKRKVRNEKVQTNLQE